MREKKSFIVMRHDFAWICGRRKMHRSTGYGIGSEVQAFVRDTAAACLRYHG